MNDQLNILFKIHSFESNKRATKQVTSPKFISLLTQAKHMTQLLRANNERVEYVLASYSNFCTCNQSLQLAAKWEGIICDFFFWSKACENFWQESLFLHNVSFGLNLVHQSCSDLWSENQCIFLLGTNNTTASNNTNINSSKNATTLVQSHKHGIKVT